MAAPKSTKFTPSVVYWNCVQRLAVLLWRMSQDTTMFC